MTFTFECMTAQIYTLLHLCLDCAAATTGTNILSLINHLLLDRYLLEAEVGKGAMGVVYAARDLKGARRVAIKAIRPDLLRSAEVALELRERFLREGDILRSLDHPNIVKMFDIFEASDNLYLVMEYVDGQDIESYSMKKPTTLQEIVDLGVKICEVLDMVHTKGIIHRDIKPSNIFITFEGQLKIMDFGVARVVDSTLTQIGSFVGTPEYMSPEQLLGKDIDLRSDLFSIGVVLYQLITSRKPFHSDSLSAVFNAVINNTPEDPATFNFAINSRLSAAIMKSLSKDVYQRHISAACMSRALREAIYSNSEPLRHLGESTTGMTISSECLISIGEDAVSDAGNLKNESGLNGVHGSISVLDIDRFNSNGRTDNDRAMIRAELRRLASSAVSALSVNQDECRFMDTGDGIAIVFPPNLAKAKLVTSLVPTVENWLIDYNREQINPVLQFKVRLSLHFGEFLIDRFISGLEGVTGEEINHAFRLVDSDLLREHVRSLPIEKPLAVIISKAFYEKLIVHQVPTLRDRFQHSQIKTKDGVVDGYLMSSDSANSKTTKRKSVVDKGKSDVTLEGLRHIKGSCIYLSTSDYHNHRLYARAARVPLVNHLETALLLGSCVILHCVDPYRMEDVCKLLEEYGSFIETGQIMFLLGREVQNVKRDFLPYIERKSAQYLESGHGEDDILSLNPPVANKDLGRVLDLLMRSPFILHRGYEGTGRFVNAVKTDFEVRETMVTTSDIENSKLRNVNLTLAQILTLQKVGQDDRLETVVASEEKLKEIKTELYRKINHDSFSRRILLDLIKASVPDIDADPCILDLLETRINLLHLRINVGSHTYIELHPNRDKNSPYFYKPLLTHIGMIADVAPRDRLGHDLLTKLTKLGRGLANYHLGAMAEIYARRMADMEAFSDNFATGGVKELKNARNLIRSYWS